MPASDGLLDALWHAIERAGDVERELRRTAEELAAWQAIGRAAIDALERDRRNGTTVHAEGKA